jgi:hypothetical protein
MAIAISFFLFQQNPSWGRDCSHCDRMSFFLTKFVISAETLLFLTKPERMGFIICRRVNDLREITNLANAAFIGQSDAA